MHSDQSHPTVHSGTRLSRRYTQPTLRSARRSMIPRHHFTPCSPEARQRGQVSRYKMERRNRAVSMFQAIRSQGYQGFEWRDIKDNLFHAEENIRKGYEGVGVSWGLLPWNQGERRKVGWKIKVMGKEYTVDKLSEVVKGRCVPCPNTWYFLLILTVDVVS